MPLHVYGVAPAAAPAPPDLAGRNEQPLEYVGDQDLKVIVSEVDADAPIRRADLLAHAHTLEAFAALSTVLPMQFGMVMLINCALGLNTPPVGTTQFVGCAIGGISVGEVMKTIWPFYAALIAALLLVTYVPAFSLWLPRLLLG